MAFVYVWGPMPVRLAASVTLLAVLGWLFGGDAYVLWQLHQEPFVALAFVPSLPFTLLGLGVAVVGAVTLVAGLLMKKQVNWRGYLVLPVLGAALVAIDLGVLAPVRPGIPVDAQAFAALSLVGEELLSTAAEGRLLAEPNRLQHALQRLGPPPFFQRGTQLGAWSVDLRQHCDGPAIDPRGRLPGTVLACVSADESTAWLTVVTLGTPVRTDGSWLEVVQAPAPGAEREADEPPPGWQLEEADAGEE